MNVGVGISGYVIPATSKCGLSCACLANNTHILAEASKGIPLLNGAGQIAIVTSSLNASV